MTALFFDIETIPSQAPDARELARAGVKPPGNMRKVETIAGWWESEGDAAVEDAYRKQALDCAAGEIAAIGWALDDSDPECLVRELGELEGDYLRRALAVIDARLKAAAKPADPLLAPWVEDLQPHPVGFNAAKFDFPFLRMRCWANRITPPRWLPGPFARAPRDYADVMMMVAGHTGMISLDKVCRALGVPSPKADGTTGADVYGLWVAGRHEELGRYCAADVGATRAAWGIMRGEYADATDAAQEVQA